LHTLGSPCPDSRTYTWKLLELPRKAIPVGALRPAAKTDAVNPGGRLMDGGRVGLKNAVLFIQSGAVDGFDTVCAAAKVGNPTSGPNAHMAARVYNRLRCIAPPQSLLSARGMFVEAAHLSCAPKGGGREKPLVAARTRRYV
jgi:hypothetical protein